jgi:hypothetical protein
VKIYSIYISRRGGRNEKVNSQSQSMKTGSHKYPFDPGNKVFHLIPKAFDNNSMVVGETTAGIMAVQPIGKVAACWGMLKHSR